MDNAVLTEFTTDMRIAKRSEVTIKDRLEVLARLSRHIEIELLAATPTDLRSYQATYAHLAPASVNIYTRHILEFYRWALLRGLLEQDPSLGLIVPRVRRGRPHPTMLADLRTIFACTDGALRMAYVFAAFAGLRCGEICRLQRTDLDTDARDVTALVDGKGGKQRRVPLIAPVVTELVEYGLPRAGWVITRNGVPYLPKQLSIDSHLHLRSLGCPTTLHSMRHYFLTNAARVTHDLLFVRDLAGHESVATTQIYTESTMEGAHGRLAGVGDLATDLLGGGRGLYAVRDTGSSGRV